MDEQVELDVEDLFNEDAGLDQGTLGDIIPGPEHPALQAPTVAPPPELVARIIDLNYCGCLKRVAWGRQGHIATISADGTTVNIQCLRLVPGTTQWRLTAARQLDQVFEDAVSLSWSPNGVDLAIVDTKGRVSFYNMTTVCLNRLTEDKQSLTVPVEEQSQPVLTFWLNQDRPGRGPKSAVLNLVKNNDRWSQNLGKSNPFGPQHMRTFLMVSKNGTLSLTYQRPDGQYRRVSMRVPMDSSTTFGHGAIAATPEDKLLMTLYSFEKRLSLYRLHIEWPGDSKANPVDPPHPKIIVEVVNPDIPMSYLTLEVQNPGLSESYPSDHTILTHLDIVPTSDIENSTQLSPQIWAVFSSFNLVVSATAPGFLQSSVIKRWNVLTAQRKLHPKFEEMPTKSENQSGNENAFMVDKLPDTQFPQIITNLELVDNGQIVMIATIDGQVELWNPINMTPASFDSDPNQVTSMAQSGFSFSPLTASVTVTLSPNASSSIVQRADQSSTLSQALYLGQPSKGLDMSDLQQSAAASSLVLAFTRACFSSLSSDDILSCMALAFQRDQPTALITRMYQVMFHPLEFIHEKAPNSQIERSIQKPFALKALSLQFALSASAIGQPLQQNGFPHPSTWARLWAWITLNLRHVSTSIVLLFKEIQQSQQGTQTTLLAPSYVDMICNMIKYTIDIYRFIFETVLEVADRQTNPDMFDEPASSPYFNLGDEKGDGSQGLVALLLNCNWSRNALLGTARPMLIFANKADPNNPNVRQIVDTIRRHSSGKGLSLSAAEVLFNGRWYQRVGLSDTEHYESNLVAERQIEMMTTGVVGQYYQNTIQDLLKKVINSENGLRHKQSTEMSRLKLFTDTPEVSWLLLNMDQYIPSHPTTKPNTLAHEKRRLYDVHKKTPISVHDPTKLQKNLRSSTTTTQNPTNAKEDTENQMIRRCTRCGSISEDVEGTRVDWPKTVISFHARCVCDGLWIVEPLFTDDIKIDGETALQIKDVVSMEDKIADDSVKAAQ